ncbi:hypothetical protein [Rhizobacter sp. Root1221]|uniref:hypothetical protein n=1 Tax=Rhizobacter sp. Root1221 TaxID=1736433 RepID=UPI0012F789DA|nr:hypothetical protein [Rhizobacter sp. Root1221]
MASLESTGLLWLLFGLREGAAPPLRGSGGCCDQDQDHTAWMPTSDAHPKQNMKTKSLPPER